MPATIEPTLKAIGSNNGKAVATHEVHPAGGANAARLAAIVAPLQACPATELPHDFDDVAAVGVTVVDAEGNPLAGAAPPIAFKLSGPGEIAAIDNGAADGHEGFRGSSIHASAGQCHVAGFARTCPIRDPLFTHGYVAGFGGRDSQLLLLCRRER